MKTITLAEVKENLDDYLQLAETIVITQDGQARGVLVGFADDDDWFDFQLENDPRFLAYIQQARADLQSGKGIPLEAIDFETGEVVPNRQSSI